MAQKKKRKKKDSPVRIARKVAKLFPPGPDAKFGAFGLPFGDGTRNQPGREGWYITAYIPTER